MYLQPYFTFSECIHQTREVGRLAPDAMYQHQNSQCSESCRRESGNARDGSGCVPDAVLRALHVLIHLILITPRGRHHYLHSSGEETGTERFGHLPKASQLGGGVRIEPQAVWSRGLCSGQLVTLPLRAVLRVCVCGGGRYPATSLKNPFVKNLCSVIPLQLSCFLLWEESEFPVP